MTTNQQLYDRDFYAWANEQAQLLRTGRLSEADIENIAEEIATLGRREKRELASRLEVLLMHLLKWQYQPVLRSRTWGLTIEEQHNRLSDHPADDPSLRATVEETITAAYRNAVLGAAREIGLEPSLFPAACRWTTEQVFDRDFLPEVTN